MTFKTGFIDPRPERFRRQCRNTIPKDLADKTMRWALHLSEEEHHWLTVNNPDTLGCPDQLLRNGYWRKFSESPESKPYRIQQRI